MNSRNGHAGKNSRNRTRQHASGGTLTSALETGSEKAHAAMETITEAANEVSERAKVARERVTTFIEERPMTSVMIGVAVGALAARLLGAFRR
ncbi:MAG: hypothetical protein AB7G11_07435 [Phycisphaerales bacterium]